VTDNDGYEQLPLPGSEPSDEPDERPDAKIIGLRLADNVSEMRRLWRTAPPLKPIPRRPVPYELRGSLLWAWDHRCAIDGARHDENPLELGHLLSHYEAQRLCVVTGTTIALDLSRRPENYICQCRRCNNAQGSKSYREGEAHRAWFRRRPHPDDPFDDRVSEALCEMLRLAAVLRP
jgi:hypothetical protein